MQFINGTIGLATFTSRDRCRRRPRQGNGVLLGQQGWLVWHGDDVVVTSATTADMTVQVTSTTHPDVALNSVHMFHFTDNGEAGINTASWAATTSRMAVLDQAQRHVWNIQLHYVVS